MANDKGTLRTCEQGHSYYKKSDCPTCPTCEAERKPTEGFLALLSAPARRALENEGITTLLQLAEYREKEILKLHGIGPSAMPKLRKALEEEGLSFKK
ncbi:RNA polymerase alpha subunit C-terminal domain-containing protein [Paenibacillus sp. FSL K6-2393]|uniref:RNA polymerase alpha subunit C-terminal domain-containing protein n=1 Tax=Paenibacillus sp. FSL K6-2393 TaxID=2921475 RepID=UPI0030FC99C6